MKYRNLYDDIEARMTERNLCHKTKVDNRPDKTSRLCFCLEDKNVKIFLVLSGSLIEIFKGNIDGCLSLEVYLTAAFRE